MGGEMSDDPIRSQIEGLGYRRLAGCLGRFALMVLACGLVFGLTAKHASIGAALSALCLITGVLLGFATSILTPSARKALLISFVIFGLAFFLAVFAMRTLFGGSQEYALLEAVAPLLLPVGYVIGQVKVPRS
jgi:hypothetical protein